MARYSAPYDVYDYVSTADPAITVNPPAVGMTHINLSNNDLFMCTNNTKDNNVWVLTTDHFICTVKTDNTGTTSDTSIGLPIKGTFEIDWGDGTVETITAAVVGTLTTHDYGVAGTYTIEIKKGLARICFYDAGDKLKLLTVEGFGKTGITTGWRALRSCSNLTSFLCDRCDTSLMTNMSTMFRDCSSALVLDVSRFDTARAAGMAFTFYNCSSAPVLDVSGFDTALVGDMTYMFYGCSSVVVLDVIGFNTARVTNMHAMFYGCPLVLILDVSGFNTALVDDMAYMFYNCASALVLDVAGFDISLVTDMSYMFSMCGIGAEWYSKALISFANRVSAGNGQLNVDMSSQDGMEYNSTVYGGTPYDNAVDARAYLVLATGSGGAGWTITADAEV